jgi:hypothetical protein
VDSGNQSSAVSATLPQVAQLERVLNDWHQRLVSGEGHSAVEALCRVLLSLRLQSADDEWLEIKSFCLTHPIRELLHQDPYTRRAYEKPRGYAGDAVMLDYVYGSTPPEGASPLGCRIFSGTTGLSNGLSVIARRDLLSQQIDELAAKRQHPRIVSFACGHLREGQRAQAVRAGAIGALYAIDQDQESLDIVKREQGLYGVTTMHASVVSLIRGKLKLDNIDFAYAAGLYDYLSDGVAAKTTKVLFDMLASEGRLLIANFMPESHGRGYMDAFMDWSLIYRTEEQLRQVMSLVPLSFVASHRLWRDQFGNIAYLEIVRG